MSWIQEVLGVQDTGGPLGTGALQSYGADQQGADLQRLQRAQAATIDPTQQAQARAAQQGLIAQLQGQASGTGPSVADMQLQATTNRNTANAMGLATAAKGISPGLALRLAGQQAASANQQAAGQSAIARLQEQQAAAGLLGQVASGMRGQDIGLATDQAGLDQQAGLFNTGQYDQLLQQQLAQQEQERQQQNAAILAMEQQRRAANAAKFGQLVGAGASMGSAALGSHATGAGGAAGAAGAVAP